MPRVATLTASTLTGGRLMTLTAGSTKAADHEHAIVFIGGAKI